MPTHSKEASASKGKNKNNQNNNANRSQSDNESNNNNSVVSGGDNARRSSRQQQQHDRVPRGSWIIHYDDANQPYWRNNDHGQLTYHLLYAPVGPHVPPHMMQQQGFVSAFAPPPAFPPTNVPPRIKSKPEDPIQGGDNRDPGGRGGSEKDDDKTKTAPDPKEKKPSPPRILVLQMYPWEEITTTNGKIWRHRDSGVVTTVDPYF